ncbi:cation:proton antiporter [Candidatus Woesearchaeota archaeon]|nr:cation:proton antiporter [Candidatus Woesearchaeota archaeon]
MSTELISLGILFACAIIGGIIATRLKQPAVFGLLLVGAIIGPNSLNLVKDAGMIKMMAEFGAILILFIIGLDFDVSKLMKLGVRSVIIGLVKFPIVVFFGYQISLLLGLSSKVAFFIGVILSFSSTVVIVKVLEQKEMFNRKEIPLLIVVLIMEDILAVLTLTFLSGISSSEGSLMSSIEHLIFSMAILVLAYMLMMKILGYGVNLILKNSRDDSVLTFLGLGIGALFSYFAAFLGLAPSAGAFLAGSLIASLPNAKEYGRAVHPYAMMFTSIFFISMGTFVDIRAINSNMVLIEVLILTVIVSRFVAIGFLTFLLANFRKEQPIFASIAMMSIGEFSLLVAKESEKFALGIDLVTITAVMIFITAIMMSLSINYTDKIYSVFSSKVPISTRLRFGRISDYMRKFFDQIEIEHYLTKKLRSEYKTALSLMAVAVISFFALRRGSLLVRPEYGHYALYGYYAVSAALMLYILNRVYRKLKEMHNTLSVVLTNIDSSRNLKKCTRMLNSLLISSLFLFTATLLPFVMFAANLSGWINAVPFVLLVPAFYYMSRFTGMIDSEEGRYDLFSHGLGAKSAAKA